MAINTHYDYDSSVVENTILNLLVASEKNFEYAPLQKEAVDKLSNNISKVIYETLKQKSIASSTKRCNLLKFLNNFCQTGEYHFDKNTYKIYLKAYEQEFCKSNNPEVENLLHDTSQELSNCHINLKNDVIEFYKRKNVKRQQRNKKLEFIKKNDQEKLSITLGTQIPRNISYYETCERLINDLLLDNTKHNDKQNTLVKVNKDPREYREKQVKFGYALANFGDKKDMEILKKILQKLSRYKNLEQFEVNFLMDLWLTDDLEHLNINKIITADFPFLVEKTVINFCTEIVKLKDAAEVSRYFMNLETNVKILRVRNVCLQDLGFYCKIKNLIFELFVFSYCNSNVYRFIDYII